MLPPTRPSRAALRLVTIAVTIAAPACVRDTSPAEAVVDQTEPSSQEWQVFTIEELRRGLEDQASRSVEFLTTATLRARLILVPESSDGEIETVQSSVVYYVLEGQGELDIEGEVVPVQSGSVVFVRGRSGRRLGNATTEMLVLALVAVGRPGLEDPLWAGFTTEDLLEPRNSNRNVLNQHFSTATLSLGAYMLPRELSGDLITRHGFDEIKVVLRGGATLDTASDVHPVERGSIVYLHGTVPHRFTRLWRDLDLLFFWAP
jgi:mannose-6-phosphate isomerase-like protein (cupin superfamily)